MQLLIKFVKIFSPAMIAACLLVTVAMPVSAATVLITGSNSGIGLEFAREYAAKGWTVIATHRRDSIPETLKALSDKYANVRVERMDVSKLNEIDALAARLNNMPIDVLINNAGIAELGEFRGIGKNLDQAFGTLNYDQFDILTRVNVRGPIKVAEAFYPNVKASKQKKIIAISSAAGMVSTPQRGGMYWYGMNKAALNKLMVTLAADVRKDGVSVAMFHPGAVKVEKFAKLDYPGMISPQESVSGMIKVIDGLTVDNTGRFWSHTGDTMPW
jgi:NAD(P)-dependent dehydrogenase (short-subunit alcohol dehydrogenase family)